MNATMVEELSLFHRLGGTMIPLENGGEAGKGFLLFGMALFFLLLLFGLAYEWKKGAFEWDR